MSGTGSGALRLLRRLDYWIEIAFYYLSAFLILLITGLVIYAVVARYFFNAAPIWSEEVPRVLFYWATFIACAVATKRGQNLRVTFLLERMAPAPRFALEFVMHLLVIAMALLVAYYSWPLVRLGMNTRMLSTGWPNVVSIIPVTIGCVLMALYQVGLIVKSYDEYRLARRAA
ncbi:MAG: TRAP transporter small permease [Alphaproteobacteria bacterium]|nr:TRAP transporter small permease [Alphaproteobacteria bacterium]